MRNIFACVVVVAALLLPCSALATDRYVDCDTGSDSSNCTNPASPCGTLQYANIQASETGDTIYAQGTCTAASGTYVLYISRYASKWTKWNSRPLIDAQDARNYGISIGDNEVEIEYFDITNAIDRGIYQSTTYSGLDIDKCFIYDNGGGATDAGASVYGDNAKIYNTIFWDNDSYGLNLLGDNAWVYNNTFLSNASWEIYVSGSNSEIDSNIFRETVGAQSTMYFSDTTNTSDYNIFDESGTETFYESGTTSTGLADWQTNSGEDAYSWEVDPMLDSTAHIGSAVSPAIDRGRPTKSIPPDDYDGQARPILYANDIGADEYDPYEIPEYSLVTILLALVGGVSVFLYLKYSSRMKRVFFGIGVVALLFLLPSAADATSRYVDCGNGVDSGPCNNPFSPCDSLGYAEMQVGNSDIIYVQGTCTAAPGTWVVAVTPATSTKWTKWNSRPEIDCQSNVQYGFGSATSGTIIEYFDVHNCTLAGINILAGGTNNEILQCEVYDNGTAGANAGVLVQGFSVEFKNNIVHDNTSFGLRLTTTTNAIHHNTFVNNISYNIVVANPSTSNQISGNIIIQPSGATDNAWDLFDTGNSSNYNIFDQDGDAILRENATSYTGLANWQAGSGEDANSLEDDPMIDATYHIASNVSPAMDRIGSKMTNIDFDGDTRPKGGLSDIGADERDMDIPEFALLTALLAMVFSGGLFWFIRKKSVRI
ncbi:MAG: right-handed parallel beta-helix repeat-containing protein [Candidatus Kerfeldbacteria bacterium]